MGPPIEQQLIDFVLTRHDRDPMVEVDLDTDLFATGYLDSIGFVGLTILVEELSGKPIDFGRIKPEDMSTIRKIMALCFPPASGAGTAQPTSQAAGGGLVATTVESAG